MQLTKEQRVFVVTNFIKTGSIKQVQDSFEQRFPGRHPPSKPTIWKNVRKYQHEGTCLNLNKERSGRMRTIRTTENKGSSRNSTRFTAINSIDFGGFRTAHQLIDSLL